MVNSCNFIGRVGQNPEVRVLQSGDKLATFSMALSEKWTDKSGEKKEKTTWINLVCFGKQSEIIEKWVTKGMLLYVETKVQVDQYEKDGVKMTATKFNIKNFTMLGGNEPKEPSSQHSSMSQPSQGYSAAFDADDDPEDRLPF